MSGHRIQIFKVENVLLRICPYKGSLTPCIQMWKQIITDQSVVRTRLFLTLRLKVNFLNMNFENTTNQSVQITADFILLSVYNPGYKRKKQLTGNLVNRRSYKKRQLAKGQTYSIPRFLGQRCYDFSFIVRGQ